MTNNITSLDEARERHEAERMARLIHLVDMTLAYGADIDWERGIEIIRAFNDGTRTGERREGGRKA